MKWQKNLERVMNVDFVVSNAESIWYLFFEINVILIVVVFLWYKSCWYFCGQECQNGCGFKFMEIVLEEKTCFFFYEVHFVKSVITSGIFPNPVAIFPIPQQFFWFCSNFSNHEWWFFLGLEQIEYRSKDRRYVETLLKFDTRIMLQNHPFSNTGTRTPVSCVRGKCANHLHHIRSAIEWDCNIYKIKKFYPSGLLEIKSFQYFILYKKHFDFLEIIISLQINVKIHSISYFFLFYFSILCLSNLN